MRDEYFIVPRALLDSVLWQTNEPMSKVGAFVELCSMASDEDRTLVIKGSELVIPKGSVSIAQTTLAKRWKWTRKKVYTFLRRLERYGYISLEKHRLFTLILITDLAKPKIERKESSAVSQLLKPMFWEEH